MPTALVDDILFAFGISGFQIFVAQLAVATCAVSLHAYDRLEGYEFCIIFCGFVFEFLIGFFCLIK